eukprot:13386117-Alexandrium_andersonii.AAC.1
MATSGNVLHTGVGICIGHLAAPVCPAAISGAHRATDGAMASPLLPHLPFPMLEALEHHAVLQRARNSGMCSRAQSAESCAGRLTPIRCPS